MQCGARKWTAGNTHVGVLHIVDRLGCFATLFVGLVGALHLGSIEEVDAAGRCCGVSQCRGPSVCRSIYSLALLKNLKRAVIAVSLLFLARA